MPKNDILKVSKFVATMKKHVTKAKKTFKKF